MRVAHVVWSMTAGGLESMLIDICKKQSAEHDVHIIVVNDQYDDALVAAAPGLYTVHKIGRPPSSRNPWFIGKLSFALMTLRPDVLHLHQLSLISIIRCSGLPIVATVHDTRFVIPALVSRIRKIICISKAVENAVHSAIKGADTEVIYNGVCSGEIRCAPKPSEGSFGILQISRLVHEKKGQDILLNAVHELRPGYRERCTLDFFGSGPSSEALNDQAQELGLGSIVRFCGEVVRSEVYKRLCDYDLLVQPSRYEGFGLTVVEAMIAGVPVIVSDIEGPMEIIENGRYGDHFICGSAKDLARKIENVMSLNSVERSERCEAARQYALENFDISRTVNAYDGVYLECVRGRESVRHA